MALGSSGWNDEPGIVSTVVEYADDGRPGRIWSESGNIVSIQRDAADRIVSVEDLSGESFSAAWDDNGNPVAVGYQAPGARDGAEWTQRRQYDELDRLVGRRENDDAPERFRYNARGAVTGHVGRSGLEVRQLHDGLGRRVGHAYIGGRGEPGADGESIVRRFEFDDGFRLVAATDAAGNRTSFRYDALDRQVGVVYADGTSAQIEYDGNGNVVRAVDQNGTETINSFDAANRLVERRHRGSNENETVERFEYDAVGRLVAASAPSGKIRRAYDSLSRPLSETQGRRTVRFATNAAGDLRTIRYPGGEVVTRRHDPARRITAVSTKAGDIVSDVRYGPAGAVEGMTLGDALQVVCTYDARQRLTSIQYRADTTARSSQPSSTPTTMQGGSHTRSSSAAARRSASGICSTPPVGRCSRSTASATCATPAAVSNTRRATNTFGRGLGVAVSTATAVVECSRTVSGRSISATATAGSGTCPSRTTPPATSSGRAPTTPAFASTRTTATTDWSRPSASTPSFAAQLIEYSYDALGRLVRKVVTDHAGTTTEYTYVWAGTVLLEEYENGVLMHTYVYGLGTRPARLSVDRGGGRTDYLFVHDGRGQASGLVVGTDPNAFAERYGYEISGGSFMKEIDGVPVDFPTRTTARSAFLNAVLKDSSLGGLRDWETGTLAGFGGSHVPQDLTEMLNSITSINGKARKGLVGVLNDQLTGYLNWLGLGGPSGSGPSGAGAGRGKQTTGDLGELGDTRSKGMLGAFGGSSDLGDTGEMDFPFPGARIEIERARHAVQAGLDAVWHARGKTGRQRRSGGRRRRARHRRKGCGRHGSRGSAWIRGEPPTPAPSAPSAATPASAVSLPIILEARGFSMTPASDS